jgi:hypothetical protein
MASDASPQIAGDMYKSRALSYAKAAALLGAPLLTSKAANAKVFFDTDVYGDKELKIATVNKMKQKLRNAILEDNTVAPDLLKLAINDALGFVTTTEDGGPDGSVQFEVGEANNKDLAKAVNVVNKIKKELQRTNVVSFGDIVSFAGAEAVETIGGPRMQVQLGRFDAKGANKSPSTGGFIDWSNPTPEAIQSNFEKSGLGPREMALLLGALGEVNRVVAETKANTKVKDEDDEDDDGNGWQDAVPSTFGARDAMYGAKMGKGDFGTKYFKDLLAGKGAAKEPVGKILMQVHDCLMSS